MKLGVIDGIDDAVITDADAPLLLSALELLASGGTWLDAKRFQLREDAFDEFRRELFKFLACAGLEFDRVLSHAACRER